VTLRFLYTVHVYYSTVLSDKTGCHVAASQFPITHKKRVGDSHTVSARRTAIVFRHTHTLTLGKGNERTCLK